MILIWFSTLLLISVAPATQAATSVCQNILLYNGDLPLTRNEKILVCGSPKGPEGWRQVPLPQAEYQLRILLQQRGYLRPRFEREGETLRVWAGPLQKIGSLEVLGASGILEPQQLRQVVGQAMTPEVLDHASAWASQQLHKQGYACAKVNVKAQVWDDKLVIEVQLGPRQRIGKIDFETGGDDRRLIERYQAIRVGDWYDSRKVELTVNRMLADGLFQNANFSQNCHGDLVDLILRTSLGPTRLVRFGFGASSEEFPFADLWFKSAKIDRRASSFTATVHASPRLQNLTVGSQLYWVPGSNRSFVSPRLRLERQSEIEWEDLHAKVGFDIGRAFDVDNVLVKLRGGPTVNYLETIRGLGPERISYLSWEGALSLTDHDYELYSRDQAEGWLASLDYRGQRDRIGSTTTADRFDLGAKYLWNIRQLSPPLFVLATRIEGVVAIAHDPRNLPREYRIFYGGDENLRGWGRKSLDNGGLGFLTSLYLGFELRLIEEMPYRLQPFLLADWARLGRESLTLDQSLFGSWGAGLRWASPFGTLRGSAAHGQILNGDASTQVYPQEWVYFVSFGQEF